MGRFFSDRVETALKYIYYDLRSGRGQEGFRLLEQAVADGDADACCILARCLYGPEYTWPGHNFPADEHAGDELMRRSVLEGSAIGTLVSLRCGIMDDKLEHTMPLESLQAAFDIVLDKAEHGEPFCQMVIGNVYYWGDFFRIQKKDRQSFDSDDAFLSYARENISRCEDWLWKSLRNGITTGGVNLANFYREGEKGLISPRPEKEIEVYRYGAEKGYPDYLFYYANELYNQGKKEEAFALYRRSAELGEPRAFFWAGYAYELGEGVPKDNARAAQYYQQALAAPIQGKTNPANRLGMFYYDGEGVERDYAKAFQLLKWAEDHGGSAMLYYLGACYANGQGTQQDYAKAFTYLERINWNCHPGFYLLGKMYCNGLGVPENIAKGVEYLQKAGDYVEVKEELRHYKKTLFGKWVRR